MSRFGHTLPLAARCAVVGQDACSFRAQEGVS
jgi:hypothetical protein